MFFNLREKPVYQSNFNFKNNSAKDIKSFLLILEINIWEKYI